MADGVQVSIVGNSLTRRTFLKGEAAKIEEVVKIRRESRRVYPEDPFRLAGSNCGYRSEVLEAAVREIR